jgi:serine/threonine protein phosphatase PrpC
MQTCPTCGETIPPNTRFCEACGAELPAVSARVTAPPIVAGACVSCGAPASSIAADGYCGQCGMKQPAPGDHREIDLAAVAAVTDRGLHHTRNEDAVAIAQVDLPDGVARIIVVCDGVSSTADSDLAAQAAADAACAVLSTVEASDTATLAKLTSRAIAGAQIAASAIPPKDGVTPSSTIVTALAVISDVADATVVVGWLGDSRAYWLRGADLHQVSDDDSWASDQIAAGMLEDDAYADARAHVITRWLGADATELEPRIETVRVPRPATLVLCSDGLWNYAPTTPALAKTIADQGEQSSNIALARALTNFARDAGGHDNITVAIATL